MTVQHARFIARTVFVKNGKVEEAFRILNRILGSEKILEHYRRIQYREKPFLKRNRLCYEKCKEIYNEDMMRKINFVMRKNRKDPYPGC